MKREISSNPIREILSTDRVYVHSDLYEAGCTEDGTPFTAEVYSIIIEREDGHRAYLTSRIWYTADSELSPDGFKFFGDNRVAMKIEADRVVDLITNFGMISTDLWRDMEPSYGSEWYCKVNGF